MPHWNGMEFRRAEAEDAIALMMLYQFTNPKGKTDPVLTHYPLLKEQLLSRSHLWLVADKGKNDLIMALCLLVDSEQEMAKIHRILIHPDWNNSLQLLKNTLPLLIHYLDEKKIEFLYATSRTMTREELELTLELGFKVLGVFPKAQGACPYRLGGMTGYFFDGVLKEKRVSNFSLHPKLTPFFHLVQKSCLLASLPTASIPSLPVSSEPLPLLELIQAQAFVWQRFSELKSRSAFSSMFYPFHKPNALITDPKQEVEIFLTLLPEYHFAAILAERLESPINASALYRQVAILLEKSGISFIEVIADAADPITIELLIEAHYIPCAYIPALKKHREKRRDYVVFTRSSEGLLRSPPSNAPIHPDFLDFLDEFDKLDQEPI